jgi:hypothetical protein
LAPAKVTLSDSYAKCPFRQRNPIFTEPVPGSDRRSAADCGPVGQIATLPVTLFSRTLNQGILGSTLSQHAR